MAFQIRRHFSRELKQITNRAWVKESGSFLEGKDMQPTVRAQSARSNRFHPFLFVFAVLLPALSAYGQNVNGSIVGTVADSTSASIPGATVTITDMNTNVTHTAQTDASGYYSVPDLAPGTY